MTRRMAAVALGAAVSVAVAGVWVGFGPSHSGDAAHTRASAPDFSLVDTEGTTRTVSALRGHVVLLNFWATYCTGCKIEMPWFVEFHRDYSTDGLQVLAVAVDERLETLRPYLQDHPVPFPVVIGDSRVVHAYNVTALPLTLLLDRHGRVAASHLGIVDRTDWEGRIQDLLAEDP